MRHFAVISILATLAWVDPVSAQQEIEDQTPAAESSQLDKLAHKAALRLAGFPAQEDEDSDESPSEPPEKSKIKLYYDESGMLLIDGLPDDIARFNYTYERILEKMKQVGPAKPDIRKYKCRHIDVTLAATMLDEIFNGPQRVRQQAARQRAQQQRNQRGRQQQRGRQAEPEPEPEPESRGAPPGLEMFESLFGGSSTRTSDPADLMGIQVVPEKRTNYLFIIAKTDLFPQIIDTLHAIDVEIEKEPQEFDIVVLQRLNADEVKLMLEDLLGITDARQAQQAGAASRRRTAQQRRGRNQQGQGAAQLAQQLAEETVQIGIGGQEFKLSDIKISSLGATNTILVFGPEAARKSIVDIIKKLDEQGQEHPVVSIPLESADAEALADTLQDSFGATRKGTESNVSISGDAASNVIYITAPENIRAEIIEQIMLAEAQSSAKHEPKTIQVLQGDAESIVAVLDVVFKERTRGHGKITIAADETTNQVIVVAPDQTFKEIAALVSKMDKPSAQLEPRFYKLKHAYAPEVKDQFDDMVRQLATSAKLGGGRSPDVGAFGVTADAATNSLMVMGTPVIFAVMDMVVEKIDIKPEDPTRRTTRTILLIKNDAAEVAGNINKLFGNPSRKREGVDPPTAEANRSTNAVVVAGTLKQIEEIEKFIHDLEELATPPEGGKIQDYTIALDYVDADQAAEIIITYFAELNRVREETDMRVHDTEKSVSVVPDLIGKRLFINASENNKKKIDEILASIDSEEARTKDVRATRVFRLKYADPNNVANIINQAFRKRGRVPEKDEVRADVDWGTQSIVVTASDRNLAKIEEMIGSLDEEGGQGKVVKIYEVKAARATELAAVLTQSMRGSERRTRQGQMPTSIVADEATNSLLITTTPAGYDKLLPTIERLDIERKANAGRFIKVYRVKYANLGSVWSAIDGAFNRGRGVKEEDRVSGAIDWETGTLIITANQDRHTEIEKMLAEIDTETAGGRKIHMVKMEFGDAGAVAQALGQIIRSMKVERGQSKPSVTADAGTNTLIIYASESELASYQPVIDSMDDEDVQTGTEPQRIELEHANAAQLADLLTQVFTDHAREQIRGTRRGGGTQKIAPLIISDDSSNTIIVRAQQLEFDQIKDMVAKLDVAGDDGPSSTRIITVAQGTDVQSFARDLERLIRQGERARKEQNRNYKPKNVSIMADTRTNTLIVSGAPSQFDEVERIAKALESMKPGGATNIRVVPLKNIRSGDVKKVLDKLIESRNQSSRGRGRRR